MPAHMAGQSRAEYPTGQLVDKHIVRQAFLSTIFSLSFTQLSKRRILSRVQATLWGQKAPAHSKTLLIDVAYCRDFDSPPPPFVVCVWHLTLQTLALRSYCRASVLCSAPLPSKKTIQITTGTMAAARQLCLSSKGLLCQATASVVRNQLENQ